MSPFVSCRVFPFLVPQQRLGQRVVRQPVAGGLQFQDQTGKLGTQVIMQVAAQVAAFLLASSDKALM